MSFVKGFARVERIGNKAARLRAHINQSKYEVPGFIGDHPTRSLHGGSLTRQVQRHRSLMDRPSQDRLVPQNAIHDAGGAIAVVGDESGGWSGLQYRCRLIGYDATRALVARHRVRGTRVYAVNEYAAAVLNEDAQWKLLGHLRHPEGHCFRQRGTECRHQQSVEGRAPHACISLAGFAAVTFRARANVGAHVPPAVSAFPYAPISSA
jgi:hypothetical protein